MPYSSIQALKETTRVKKNIKQKLIFNRFTNLLKKI